MAFSNEWEAVYKQGAQNSVWPWSDLVTYVMRYSRPDRQPFKVLELGFGAGANIPFLLSLGMEYYGTEGSQTAVDRAKQRFQETNFQAACCDFTSEIPFDATFDLIVDRSSLTHNGTQAIHQSLERLKSMMRPGAKFIGIDWFSTDHSDFSLGEQEEDYFTRVNFPTGQFKGVGRVHFSDEGHLIKLFNGFNMLRMERKVISTCVPAENKVFGALNFVCEKQA